MCDGYYFESSDLLRKVNETKKGVDFLLVLLLLLNDQYAQLCMSLCK